MRTVAKFACVLAVAPAAAAGQPARSPSAGAHSTAVMTSAPSCHKAGDDWICGPATPVNHPTVPVTPGAPGHNERVVDFLAVGTAETVAGKRDLTVDLKVKGAAAQVGNLKSAH